MPVKDPADSSVPHCEIALGVHCEPTDLFTVWWDMLHMHFSGHRGQEESSLKIVNFFSKSKKNFLIRKTIKSALLKTECVQHEKVRKRRFDLL